LCKIKWTKVTETLKLKKYSFAARIINDWTLLPINIGMATNTTSFKTLWMFTGMINDSVFCNEWYYKLCFPLEPLIIKNNKYSVVTLSLLCIMLHFQLLQILLIAFQAKNRARSTTDNVALTQVLH